MSDKYHVYLYYDTVNQIQIRTFESAVTSEEYCRMLYFQLRSMGAKGEIRVLRTSTRRLSNNVLTESKQVAFVSLYDQYYKYVRT